MPNLKEPITSLSVIYNTLVTTKRCAEECEQWYGIVTYDLNAAKPAMQIQVTEAPAFNNIFVMLGPFHIEMAFFKAIGKLICESGGPSMLTDTEVLAPGSLNGFITGKHFNRCKRIHPLLALALEALHFQAFLATSNERDAIETLINDHNTQRLSQAGSSFDLPTNDVFLRCETAYEGYTNQTRKGEHGILLISGCRTLNI